MQHFHSSQELQKQCLQWKKQGLSIGLVPTMGALHEGHLSLIDILRPLTDKLIVSIFVNPSQFAPGEDLSKYPRTLEQDIKGCSSRGADAVFLPQDDDMYFSDKSCWIDEEQLSLGLCGHSRPGHFRGVCTVVAKLFNICLPDHAVFGEKDYQQLQILKRMQRDLNFPVTIHSAPIIREENGLAISSRNCYLTPEERDAAGSIYRALSACNKEFASGRGLIPGKDLIQSATEIICEAGGKVDYIKICNHKNLEVCEQLEGSEYRILAAAHFGQARLIDNMRLMRE